MPETTCHVIREITSEKSGFFGERLNGVILEAIHAVMPKAHGHTRNPPAALPADQLGLDLSGDYRLNARYGLYFTARNVFNDRDQNYAYALGSPRYVKFAAEGEYGVNFQFGIKGNF